MTVVARPAQPLAPRGYYPVAPKIWCCNVPTVQAKISDTAMNEFDAYAGTVTEPRLIKIDRKPRTLPNGEPMLTPMVPESWEPVDFMDKEDTAEFMILHCPGVDSGY